MKIITVKDVSKIESYINEETNKLELTIKYNDYVSVLHTTEHTNLYFNQFNKESEGLYWLSKDPRIKDLPNNMIKRDVKEFLLSILEIYPDLIKEI